MAEDDPGHVFISYVREDGAKVDELCAILDAAKIPYWRDRSDLGPGDAWKIKIREAIQGGSLAFLACFSDNSRAKARSYMNEEITIAVEEFRKMPPGHTWLIPVRFDFGDVPAWDLGAGRILTDFNYSDLHGDKYVTEVAALITKINQIIGEKSPSPGAIREVIQQASDTKRVELLQHQTKEMLLDPTRRIELDDLISQEAKRILDAITEPTWVAGPLGGEMEERVLQVATQAQRIMDLSKPFCASLQVASRWGSPSLLSPWSKAITSFVRAANVVAGGNSDLLNLRHIPGVAAIMTCGIACVSSGRWENLKALVADNNIRERQYSATMSILEATDPYQLVDSQALAINALARGSKTGTPLLDEVQAVLDRRNGKLYTPAAEWLYYTLRALFRDQLPDEDSYAEEFDRAEVVLGVVATDAVTERIKAMPEGKGWGHSRWFGRSTWRAAHMFADPASELHQEVVSGGEDWEPLRADLFGGNKSRAEAAARSYSEEFTRAVSSRL